MSASTDDSKTGRKNVKLSHERLTSNVALKTQNGITVFTSPKNVCAIWIGFSDSFTIDLNDATDGFPLEAGSSLFIPTRTPSEIYVASAVENNQKIWWIVS